MVFDFSIHGHTFHLASIAKSVPATAHVMSFDNGCPISQFGWSSTSESDKMKFLIQKSFQKVIDLKIFKIFGKHNN